MHQMLPRGLNGPQIGLEYSKVPVQTRTFPGNMLGDAAPVSARWKAFSRRAIEDSTVHMLLLARTLGLDSRSGYGALAIFFQSFLLIGYLASAKLKSVHRAGCPANEVVARKTLFVKWMRSSLPQMQAAGAAEAEHAIAPEAQGGASASTAAAPPLS